MKLRVEGIEEIEITDPKGVCKLAALPALPIQQQPRPMPQPQVWPIPQLPTPGSPWGTPFLPHKSIYTRHVHEPKDAKWGVGGPMIQQAGEKNLQANMSGEEGQEDGNQHTQ